MTTQQLQRAVTALGQAWQHETNTPFDATGFIGTVTLQAFAKGFPSPDAFREALILSAYELGGASQGSAPFDRKMLDVKRKFAQLAHAAIAL